MDALNNALEALRDQSVELVTERSRISVLETALSRMVAAHETLSANTEGQYPYADIGCIECTAGTVPDRVNTGLCAYHNAKKLLGQS